MGLTSGEGMLVGGSIELFTVQESILQLSKLGSLRAKYAERTGPEYRRTGLRVSIGWNLGHLHG